MKLFLPYGSYVNMREVVLNKDVRQALVAKEAPGSENSKLLWKEHSIQAFKILLLFLSYALWSVHHLKSQIQ